MNDLLINETILIRSTEFLCSDQVITLHSAQLCIGSGVSPSISRGTPRLIHPYSLCALSRLCTLRCLKNNKRHLQLYYTTCPVVLLCSVLCFPPSWHSHPQSQHAQFLNGKSIVPLSPGQDTKISRLFLFSKCSHTSNHSRVFLYFIFYLVE